MDHPWKGWVGLVAVLRTAAGVSTDMKEAMKIIAVLAVTAVVLIAATTASAQQASQDGYRNSAGAVQGQVNQGGPTGTSPVSESSGGSLPFTGLDMVLLAAAGGLLVAAGFGMRRLTRIPDSA
jgi:hypothetical protein